MIRQLLHRIVPLLIFALLAADAVVISPASARAQDQIPAFDPGRFVGGRDLDCGDFRSQAEAQAVLRTDPTDPNGLDLNRDGIACQRNGAPHDLIPVPRDFDPRTWLAAGVDLYDCGDFRSQAEA